jgi:hypothetical protein
MSIPKRFRLISVAVVVLGVILIAVVQFNFAYWQPLDKLLSPAQVATIVDQNTTLFTRDLRKILGHQESVGNDNLLLVNYNDAKLCGSLGCLYSAYIWGEKQPLTRVLNIALVANTAKEQPVLATTKVQDKVFPCLRSLQPAANKGQEEFIYCVRGGEYQLQDQRLLANSER